MPAITTIRISLRTKELLDNLKQHKKESYEDVIGRLAATTQGSHDDTPGSVRESAGRPADDSVESRLRDIVARLERLEEQMHENVYPHESKIQPACIRRIKKAHADICKGRCKTYESMDAFCRAISE